MPENQGRSAVANFLRQHHLQCKERLANWLEEQLLLDQVELSEPGFLPNITAHCPPFISKLLATHPDVEVVMDGNTPMGLIK